MKFQVRIRRELCLYKALDIEAASSEDAENQVQKLLNDGIPDSEFTGDGFEDEILDVTTHWPHPVPPEIKMSEFPDYGDKMTIAEFIHAVKGGCFVDYDGFGEFATDIQVSDQRVKPSDIEAGKEIPNWATHVIWFNR